MSLLTQYLDWFGDPDRAVALAPKLAELLDDARLADCLMPRLGAVAKASVCPVEDGDDVHDLALMLHADGSLTLFMVPEGELSVPEFLTCMAELRRRAGDLVHRMGRRVRAVLATHEHANMGRCLAMVAACNSYGVHYLPLPNLIERL